MHLLLSGIVGSQAYGLATPASDTDRRGIFAVPTEELFGLRLPKDSVVTTKPDVAYDEAAKWVRLALGGNPTVMELVWLPDELYEVRTDLGDHLIAIRSSLLCAPRVRDAYLGYALQQFRKLKDRGDGSFSADLRNRTEKHARHLARLLRQGEDLYATGELTVRLDNPDWYRQFGESVAKGRLWVAEALLNDAVRRMEDIRSPLPDRADERPAEAWLQRVRRTYLTPRS